MDGNGGCVKICGLDRCVAQVEPTKCAQCSDDSYPDSAGLCQPLLDAEKIKACLIYDSLKKCVQCRKSFALYNNVCYDASYLNSTACINYHIDNNGLYCDSCVFGYAVNEKGSCVPTAITVKFCKDHTPNGQCLRCFSNYSLQNAACVQVCDKLIDQCLFHKGDKLCDKFDYPLIKLTDTTFQLRSTSTVFISNCLQNESDTTCAQCRPGFFPSADKKACVSVKDENCADYRDVFNCFGCKDGFVLQDVPNKEGLRCLPFQPTSPPPKFTPENCIKLVGKDCKQLKPGFFIDPNTDAVVKKVPGIPRCKHYSGPGVCLVCDEARVVNGFCDAKVLDPEQPNCKLFDANGCVKCKPGFLRSGYKCLQNCAVANEETNKCVVCQPGNVLSDGKCVPPPTKGVPNCYEYRNSTCAGCDEGFMFNPSDPLAPCVPAKGVDLRNCLRALVPKCVQCVAGSEESSGTCQPLSPNLLTTVPEQALKSSFFMDKQMRPVICNPFVAEFDVRENACKPAPLAAFDNPIMAEAMRREANYAYANKQSCFNKKAYF